MTCAGRRVMVICVVAAVASSVSACRVLQHAESPTSSASITAAGLPIAPSTPGDAASCPFSADEVSASLGGAWVVSSLPSGGCNYTQGSRTILVSELPLPKDARGRHAALAQTRKPCDAGSTVAVPGPAEAFVCRQGTMVEAAAVAEGRLVVACTEAGSDPARLPGIRAALCALVVA